MLTSLLTCTCEKRCFLTYKGMKKCAYSLASLGKQCYICNIITNYFKLILLMFMKILAYVLFAFSALLASCHRAPIVVNADEIAATKQLNEKYHDLIVGHWHHFSQTELTEVTQEFVFKADGTYTGHILYRSRQQVMIGGKPMLTDWTKQIDEDLEGQWGLMYSKSQSRNLLRLSSNSHFIGMGIIEFFDANQSKLIVESPLAIESGRIEFSRK